MEATVDLSIDVNVATIIDMTVLVLLRMNYNLVFLMHSKVFLGAGRNHVKELADLVAVITAMDVG